MAKSTSTAKKPAKPKTPKTKTPPGTPALAPTAPLVRPTTRTKFTLYNLLGKPRAYYLVEPMELPRTPSKTQEGASPTASSSWTAPARCTAASPRPRTRC